MAGHIMGKHITKESEVEEKVWLDNRFFPPKVVFKNDRIEMIAYLVFVVGVMTILAFCGVF